jgi:hypothetical protein
MRYRTNIEITSDAANRDEAMEIAGDYLSGNIASGIDMKYATRPVRFYNSTASKAVVVVLLMAMGFLSGVNAKPQQNFSMDICQMATVTPPLKTSDANKNSMSFRREWEEKQSMEAINYIKR